MMKCKIVRTIATIGMIIGAYLLGTSQAEIITEVQTVTQVQEVEKLVEVIPDGYIDTNSDDFYNNFIDMRDVADFVANGDSLQLYLYDGNYYYWER